ncbi:hypothetical protein DTO164E3_5537 [Paecilomyces variotii]|nr:hypothetical protein DTO164E3_5537 [Paecilomyces variotii]KAJ9225666.1 hypothetical protein DTO169C6_2102 [Paecilomyces variotii]KAJ9248996.1 hypothetical protein DTO195F2_8642 [Paecilomyces variotii]KAJ9291886.1 hypothetical protein DTO021C3_326 [Paecilomyces variotii]KAJ9321075.1 hypothetical protein DTO027B3_7932 [Paecilomyces variotii]
MYKEGMVSPSRSNSLFSFSPTDSDRKKSRISFHFSNHLIKHFKRSSSLPKQQSKCLPALATAAPATAPPAPAPAALTKQLSPNIPMGPSLPPPLRQPCVDSIMS